MSTEKKIAQVFQGPRFHMVGDGFRVKNYLSPGGPLTRQTSPFLLLDYMPRQMVEPTENAKRGVGPHPHRGFETVSLAFAGSVVHKDSAGNGGVIGPGDVQWMTAGSGVLHSEYHEKNFARAGGAMHFMQIWVNLPAAQKMHKPRYQALTAEQMGPVILPNNAGVVKVIAGSFQGVRGPAETFTPLNLFDVTLHPQGKVEFSFPETENTSVMVMEGEVWINGRAAHPEDFVLFENRGETVVIEADSEAHLVFLNGEPIDEPVAAYGPFVMNSEGEILKAMADFRGGRFGYLVE